MLLFQAADSKGVRHLRSWGGSLYFTICCASCSPPCQKNYHHAGAKDRNTRLPDVPQHQGGPAKAGKGNVEPEGNQAVGTRLKGVYVSRLVTHNEEIFSFNYESSLGQPRLGALLTCTPLAVCSSTGWGGRCCGQRQCFPNVELYVCCPWDSKEKKKKLSQQPGAFF